MLRALDEYEIEGLTTLIPFHNALLATEQWANGETCRDLVEDKDWLKTLAVPEGRAADRRRRRAEETVEQTYTVEVSGRRFDVKVIGPPFARRGRRATAPRRPGGREAQAQRAQGAAAAAAAPTRSPRRCRATCGRSLVEQGQAVEEGQLLCIIEAMKMENEITAHKAGVIEELADQGGRRRSPPAPRSRSSRARTDAGRRPIAPLAPRMPTVQDSLPARTPKGLRLSVTLRLAKVPYFHCTRVRSWCGWVWTYCGFAQVQK